MNCKYVRISTMKLYIIYIIKLSDTLKSLMVLGYGMRKCYVIELYQYLSKCGKNYYSNITAF